MAQFFFFIFKSKCTEKKHTSKQLIVEALYFDLEDLKQSKSDGEKMIDGRLRLLGRMLSTHPTSSKDIYLEEVKKEQRNCFLPGQK